MPGGNVSSSVTGSDAELREWIVWLSRSPVPETGTSRERGRLLAETLADSMSKRPVMCDLISAQAAVLERNISTDVALHRLAPVLMTDTAQLGHAALNLARHGYTRRVLENRDIITVATSEHS